MTARAKTPALALGIAICVLGLTGACTSKPTAAVRAPVPVQVATVGRADVPQAVEALGTVEAFETVALRPQVAGQVVAVAFKEGTDVKKGDLLFRIDARPYQAALAQAEANHARDQAQATNAAADAQRAESLFQEGVLSKEQHDLALAQARAQAAEASAGGAAAQTARLSLGYAEIRAPISGRTGRVLVHLGNVVKAADDNPLVVINRIDPIYVTFAIPEQKLPAVRAADAAHQLAALALIAGDPRPPVAGHLSFVDNEVDRQTGTIRLKAEFPNHEGRLWPGQFVTARLTLGVRNGAVVVPSEAVQAGQKGSYVFVMKADHTVEQRTVVGGGVADGRTVVESGVVAGETVVTDGQMSLAPGSKVAPKP